MLQGKSFYLANTSTEPTTAVRLLPQVSREASGCASLPAAGASGTFRRPGWEPPPLGAHPWIPHRGPRRRFLLDSLYFSVNKAAGRPPPPTSSGYQWANLPQVLPPTTVTTVPASSFQLQLALLLFCQLPLPLPSPTTAPSSPSPPQLSLAPPPHCPFSP